MVYVVNAVVISVHSVGQPKHSRVMAGGLEGEFFFGSKAEVCMSRPSSLICWWSYDNHVTAFVSCRSIEGY